MLRFEHFLFFFIRQHCARARCSLVLCVPILLLFSGISCTRRAVGASCCLVRTCYYEDICAKYPNIQSSASCRPTAACGNLRLCVLTVHARRCEIEQVSMTSEWVFNSSCYILVKVSNLCTILPRSHAYERAARVFCKISTRLQPYVIGSACALELT